jgi:PIN domain nuclease of toxin-antitoxin system
VNAVTDTHPLVWYLSGADRRLSSKARKLFAAAEAGRSTLYVPAVVMMEIVLLDQMGRIRVSYAELREQLSLRPSVRIEPLTAEDVDEARGLASVSDPFDRLIAGTSLRLGIPLLTRDEVLRQISAVRTVW